MALSQRSGIRFFAAFHRWSCYTQRQPLCESLTNPSGSRRPVALPSRRTYLTTQPCRQKEAPFAQRAEGENDDVMDDWVTPDVFRGEHEFGAPQLVRRVGGRNRKKASTPGPVSDDIKSQLAEAREKFMKEFAPVPGAEAGAGTGAGAETGTWSWSRTGTGAGAEALRDELRALMRRVPSSVAVVTAASFDPATHEPVPLGSTISSLNTVTLDPPTVSFNIKFPSKTLDAIRAANGRFRVHLLKARKRSAHVADLFTQGNDAKAYKARRDEIKFSTPTGIPRVEQSFAPQIQDTCVGGALECHLTQEIVVADHVILVAKVDSLSLGRGRNRGEIRLALGQEQTPLIDEPMLLYADGSYQRAGSATSYLEHRVFTPDIGASFLVDNLSAYWESPLFPGAKEKRQFVEHIKRRIEDNNGFPDISISNAVRQLFAGNDIPDDAFGVNFHRLIGEVRQELGQDPGWSQWNEHDDLFSDFYGQIALSDLPKIADRARQLIKAEPRSLAMKYPLLLNALGVHNGYKGLLPSDILNPLRAAGLVGPVVRDPRALSTAVYKNRIFAASIESYEEIELRLREILKYRTYEEAMLMTNYALDSEMGESGFAPFIQKIRDRIFVEAFPDDFSPPNINIAGVLTKEEVRVVIARVMFFLNVKDHRGVPARLRLPVAEVLRKVRVHPLVEGADFDYLHGKILYLFKHNRYKTLEKQVDVLLGSWFKEKVQWGELNGLVQGLVKKLPLRVVSWSIEDLLAAMGLHLNATVTPPIGTTRTLSGNGSYLLTALFARELKARYGNGGTREEDEAIARFLKEKYDYEVRMPRGAQESAGLMDDPRSSDQELADAMLRNLKVDISPYPQNRQTQQTDVENMMHAPSQTGQLEWTHYGIDGQELQRGES